MSIQLATLSYEVTQEVVREFSEGSSLTLASDKDLSNWRTFTRIILAWEAQHKKHAKRECALKLKSIAQNLDDNFIADADKLMELYKTFIRGQYF